MFMKLIVIADLHYGEEHKNFLRNIFNSHIILNDLEDLFISLEKSEEKHWIIFLGDQIYRNTKEKDIKHIEDIKHLLKKYNLNYNIVLGNHELYNFSKQEALKLFNMDSCYFEKIIDGVQYIFLDVVKQIKSDNAFIYDYKISIDQEQINWLDKKLSQNYKKTIIFSHAPLNYFDISNTPWFTDWKEKINISEYKKVQEILKKYDKEIICINGHVHECNEFFIDELNFISVDSFSRFLDETNNKKIRPKYLEIDVDTNIKIERKMLK